MTIIWQTGADEGAVYNALGTNLTEAPDGNRNFNVGSYYYDFAGLFGLGHMYTNELTVVIADGRKLITDADDEFDTEFDDFDPDEANENTVDYGGLEQPGRPLTVTSVSFEFRLGNPSYADVDVMQTVEGAEGVANAVIDNSGAPGMTLQEWLDAAVSSAAETTGDADIWTKYRAYLRWSLHWALYKIPLVRIGGEGTSDDIQQSGLSQQDEELDNERYSEPIPQYGPIGLLYAEGAYSGIGILQYEMYNTPWVRLWEPGERTYKPIRSGTIAGLNYCIDRDRGTGSLSLGDGFPEGVGEADTDISGDPLDYDLKGDTEAADQMDGREVVLRRTLRNLHVRIADNEMLVLHIQTGRARLQAPSIDGAAYEPGLVIAKAAQPAMGPKFTLHHGWVSARARHS